MKPEIITFVQHDVSPFVVKLADVLKRNGFKVNCVSFYQLKDSQKETFDHNIFLVTRDGRNLSKFRKLIKFFRFIFSLLQQKKSIVIGVTCGLNWFVMLIFVIVGGISKTKIYFPYDIGYFRYRNYSIYPLYVRIAEKYNFRCCDGIIHKGPEDELKYLPKGFNSLSKPNIQFLPYCDKELFLEINDDYFKRKLSIINGRTHLVFAGAVHENKVGYCNDHKVFEKIIQQKLYLDVFATNFNYLKDLPIYKKLCKNKYFKLQKPIFGKKFQFTLGRYDWGILIHHHDLDHMRDLWDKTAFSNRISSYLESGIPIIVKSKMEFNKKIIDNLGIGISVNNEEEISKKIANLDYKTFFQNAIKKRGDFSWDSNVKRRY